MAGVRWATVTRSRAIQAASRPGVAMSSEAGTQIVAPRQSGVNRSRCSGSWARPESRLKRSSVRSPKRSRCQGRKWESGPCRPRIPLGTPVEPEVNAR